MANRSDMKALVDAINKYPDEVKKLTSKDLKFFYSMADDVTHYGYTFTEKQSKWLQAIYRKVYSNVEEV